MPPDARAPASTASTQPVTQPDLLKAWLESLALAQMLDAGRAIRQYLVQLDGAAIDSRQRSELLDLVRAPADMLLEGLDRICAHAAQPLGAHARDAVALARGLAAELAKGYEHAAKDNAASSPSLKELPSLFLHAMRYLARAMHASYRTYSRVPPGAWLRMHELYLRADQAGAASDAEEGEPVSRAYCDALLLALTDPYRLPPGELDRVLAVIRTLPVAPTLTRGRPTTRGAQFVVPCAEDKPPRPPLPDGEADTDGWVLNAQPVVEALREALQELGSGSTLAARMLGRDSLGLLARLATLWGDPPKRAYRRDPADGSVAICVGVKPIAQFVAHDATADGEAELQALRRGITMPLRTLPEDESGRIVPIHEWAVVNLSEGGLKVRRSSRATTEIAVGDVVGIKAAGKALWTIGLARWINALEDDKTEFGVQFFADAVCAVWVRGPSGGRKLGVLLASGEEHGRESVLAPPHTYVEGREYELRGEDYRSRVRAIGLVEGNARFELFHIEAI
jgi:hypothetical protein